MQAHQRSKIVQQTSEKGGDGQFFCQLDPRINYWQKGVYRKRGNVHHTLYEKREANSTILLQPLVPLVEYTLNAERRTRNKLIVKKRLR